MHSEGKERTERMKRERRRRRDRGRDRFKGMKEEGIEEVIKREVR